MEESSLSYNSTVGTIGAWLRQVQTLVDGYHGSRDMYHQLRVHKTSKWWYIEGVPLRATKRGYIFARIDPLTGDIYPPNGKKVRGNINDQYAGLAAVDCHGVIVNQNKYERRLAELSYNNP